MSLIAVGIFAALGVLLILTNPPKSAFTELVVQSALRSMPPPNGPGEQLGVMFSAAMGPSMVESGTVTRNLLIGSLFEMRDVTGAPRIRAIGILGQVFIYWRDTPSPSSN